MQQAPPLPPETFKLQTLPPSLVARVTRLEEAIAARRAALPPLSLRLPCSTRQLLKIADVSIARQKAFSAKLELVEQVSGNAFRSQL